MKEKRLVKNAIQTADGTILESLNIHDYKVHLDQNGEEYVVYGGLEYLGRNATKEPYIELSVYDNDPHEMIRHGLHWGTYGKDGDQPFSYAPIKDLTDCHINALLEYPYFSKWKIIHLKNELKFRENNKIKNHNKRKKSEIGCYST
jgi:hypothetical protein